MIALLLASLIVAVDVGAAKACTVDHAAMMKLTPEAFDQDQKSGWRPLADKAECRGAAANLIRDFRESNRPTLKSGELHISYWHEGQLRAVTGDAKSAVPLLLAGAGPADVNDFTDYALGTVAFLLRDREALRSARQRLSKLPEPATWKAAQAEMKRKFHFEPAWPPTLDVLDGLLACFERSYAEAYSPACRPPH